MSGSSIKPSSYRKAGVVSLQGSPSWKGTRVFLTYLEERLQGENVKPAYLWFNLRSSSLPASNCRERKRISQPRQLLSVSLRHKAHIFCSGVCKRYRCPGNLAPSKHRNLPGPVLLCCSPAEFPRRNVQVSSCFPSCLPRHHRWMPANVVFLASPGTPHTRSALSSPYSSAALELTQFFSLLNFIYMFGHVGMWDFSSATRNHTCVLCIGSTVFNHWIAREVPRFSFLEEGGDILRGSVSFFNLSNSWVINTIFFYNSYDLLLLAFKYNIQRC